jgi:hypothetical protein
MSRRPNTEAAHQDVLSKVKNGATKRPIAVLKRELAKMQSIAGFRLLAELYEIRRKSNEAVEAYMSALGLAIEHEDKQEYQDLINLLSNHGVEVSETEGLGVDLPFEVGASISPVVSLPAIQLRQHIENTTAVQFSVEEDAAQEEAT